MDTSGYDREAARIAAAVPKITGLASKVVGKSLVDLKSRARALAPVDTGNLRSSITSRRTGALSGEVLAGAEYAIYVEHGTHRMAAQPYMTPATDAIEPGFIEAIAQVPEVALGN